mmetsp:Transcript_28763/g.80991  ORF Transcript_28763/g.80991 Transcript_28763/m.80991 type:complete len:307 (+) Transcript_28763:189-1109(+)|eukprot:CAMPEP_0117668604 /NCGR_PEP_ID=MMETSP0804-20121206/11648_1 /TAXON_ID=1074897 /ORGANISM="Tetraselmis astigmatica, Strain CCMP880" /LENGTH=306 /DNA_ID=CAMNT_0005476527 /DNA_START=189 /DNA_END=1109 /DNA_ORIENTATION=+
MEAINGAAAVIAWPQVLLTAAVVVGEVCLVIIAWSLWKLSRDAREALPLLRRAFGEEVPTHPLDIRETSLKTLEFADLDTSRTESSDRSDDTSEYDQSTEAPLLKSKEGFSQCMVGEEDVDVQKFMEASREFSKVLSSLGSFTKSLVGEVESNIKKIESFFSKDPQSYTSMRALLEAEQASGIHQSGGKLADPSSAMGLVWARRGLNLWVTTFEEILKSGEKVDLRQCAQKAYSTVLEPHNGFVTRSSFGVTFRRFPKWERVHPRLGSSEQLHQNMEEWVSTLKPLMQRMEKMHADMDLESTIRTI